jgi:hypothetical protein
MGRVNLTFGGIQIHCSGGFKIVAQQRQRHCKKPWKSSGNGSKEMI